MRKQLLGTAVAICLVTFCLFAEDSGKAAAAKISTLGLGVEIQKSCIEKVNFRLGLNSWKLGRDDTNGGIAYEADLNLFSITALADWHPFGGVFRLSGGLLYNGNELEMKAKLAGATTVTVGNVAYAVSPGDSLNAKVDFNAIAPYLGIGWGNAVRPGKKWGFLFDLGVVFQGSPDATISASGPIVTNPAFAADVARETSELKNDLDSLDIYPVVSLGVSYQF